MLKTILAIAAVASLASFAGCDEARSGQRAFAWDGPAYLISAKRHVVMLQAGEWEMDFYRRPRFVVAIRNMQDWTVPFRVANIEAARILDDGTTTNLRVLGYDALAAREQERHSLERYGAKLQSPLDPISAPSEDSTESFHSKGSDSRPVHTDDTYNAYQSYTPRQLAGAQTSADFAMFRAQGQANLAASGSNFVKNSSLRPGEWYGGTFVLDDTTKTESATYVIAISIDIETHEFQVRRNKIGQH